MALDAADVILLVSGTADPGDANSSAGKSAANFVVLADSHRAADVRLGWPRLVSAAVDGCGMGAVRA